ncbi:MAG: DUF1579 family protein [Phycisphaerae bacterium]
MRLPTLLCAFACGAGTMLFTTGVASMADSGASDAELREAVKQAARPGKFHKKIKHIRGQYVHEIKWWSAPNATPKESDGRGDTEWALGGRFMVQNIEAKWLDTSFEAMLILGYDNTRQEYTSVWMDSLGTDMLISKGKIGESGETITSLGEYIDVTTGETVKVRSVFLLPARNRDMKLEMFRPDANGQEYKFMEVVTKRRVLRGA